MRNWTFASVFAGLLIVGSTATRPAWAAWPPLGRVLCAAPNAQENPKIATDGVAGAIVVWQDSRSTKVNIFARRVLASGELDPAWPVDGRALLTDSSALAGAIGGQAFPVIVSDGAGGAIVAWRDRRAQATDFDIFAQHVLASGVVDPAWPANGRALCTALGQQDLPRITSDGAGGAIVTWMDLRPDASVVDIYAQHVLANGTVDPRWPVNGTALSTAPAAQAFPNIVSDGAGGAIVTWHDFRPAVSGIDIYAQRVSNAGVVDPAWPANGRALCLAASAQVDPTIVSDGANGAIVTWSDGRNGAGDIFAQRVLGSSAIAAGWPADGRAVCLSTDEQSSPIIASDGAGGALIGWLDARSGHDFDPFAQHVLASGAIDPEWPVDGRLLGASDLNAADAEIVTDGAGGAIVAWDEDSFVMVQHVRSNGVIDPAFPPQGRFVRLNIDFQHKPDLVPSGAGNAIVTWQNSPTGPNFDIFATLVEAAGTVAVDPGTPATQGVTFARPSPNPAFGAVTLRFALPRAASVSLAIYDTAGRRVRAIALGARPEGEHALAWDLRDETGNVAGSGIYFARLEVEGRVLTHKLVKPN